MKTKEFPCLPGDAVYIVTDTNGIMPGKVAGITFDESTMQIEVFNELCDAFHFELEDYGKEFFGTLEDAKAYIKKLETPAMVREAHYENEGEPPCIKLVCPNGCHVSFTEEIPACPKCGQHLVFPKWFINNETPPAQPAAE